MVGVYHFQEPVTASAVTIAQRAATVVKQEMLAEAQGWVEWRGGVCPVDGSALVEIRLSGTSGLPEKRPARDWNWTHTGWESDIIAYRVVSSPVPTTNRYPEPVRADYVTLWKRGQQPILSIIADGKVHDFHVAAPRLAVLLREVADLLAESTILK
ncbi:hypothetical protein [Bosea sp. LjRoot237]|uniref:hypothetical protein n=1 Tax=Bosea sp. LjRoot237 TaxID=3342292 RepID=UPI003ECDC273